jgi:hypothetical protein
MRCWQIGRDFERYVGYRYESLGYDVEYMGIVKGLEDLGRERNRKPKRSPRGPPVALSG